MASSTRKRGEPATPAICIPERYKVIVETSRSENRLLHEVETEVLGFTHADVGAYLLGLWGLPFTIVEAVASHHNPSGAGEKTFGVTSATALADSLVDSLTTSKALVDLAHLGAVLHAMTSRITSQHCNYRIRSSVGDDY